MSAPATIECGACDATDRAIQADTTGEANAVNCVHHWVIETPSGPTSPGTCKRCGVTRQHANWVGEGWTERDLQPDSVARGQARGNLSRWERRRAG